MAQLGGGWHERLVCNREQVGEVMDGREVEGGGGGDTATAAATDAEGSREGGSRGVKTARRE